MQNLRSFADRYHHRHVEYRRNLPHFQPDGATLFITFRLYGTLPIRSGRDGRSFVAADRELETTDRGPNWLKQSHIALCVTRIIQAGDRVCGWYDLIAFVVMPNHVYLLIDPKAPAPRITQYVKGVSAKEASRLLGRTGQTFWQDESYDRWVRSLDERNKIIRYIELNPVRANLATEPGLFRYSSAFHEYTELRTG